MTTVSGPYTLTVELFLEADPDSFASPLRDLLVEASITTRRSLVRAIQWRLQSGKSYDEKGQLKNCAVFIGLQLSCF